MNTLKQSETCEALAWALDIIDMYDKRLAEIDGWAKVYSPIHMQGKAKARAALSDAIKAWNTRHADTTQGERVEACVTELCDNMVPLGAWRRMDLYKDKAREILTKHFSQTQQQTGGDEKCSTDSIATAMNAHAKIPLLSPAPKSDESKDSESVGAIRSYIEHRLKYFEDRSLSTAEHGEQNWLFECARELRQQSDHSANLAKVREALEEAKFMCEIVAGLNPFHQQPEKGSPADMINDALTILDSLLRKKGGGE